MNKAIHVVKVPSGGLGDLGGGGRRGVGCMGYSVQHHRTQDGARVLNYVVAHESIIHAHRLRSGLSGL